MLKYKIAPSLLSADFSKLKDEISMVEKCGIDLLHLDVMDGHFVPNLTIGPFIVEAIRRCTTLPLDVHLMIDRPGQYTQAFKKAGADMISFHIETSEDIAPLLKNIRALKAKAGLALNPNTPTSKIVPFLSQLDYVLVMSVNPGFAGQAFESGVLSKIQELKTLREKNALSFEIEVDGGINEQTIAKTAEAGANIFVAGSSIFKSSDYEKTIKTLRKSVHG